MSLIADALKKAQQKSWSSNRSSQSTPPPNKPWWVLGIAFVFVGAFVYWAWPTQMPRSKWTPSAPKNYITPSSASSQKPQPILAVTTPIGIPPLVNLSWKVDGVIVGGAGRPAAIINGEFVEEGSEVSGAKLVRVNTNEVELLHNGEPVRLAVRTEE